MNFIEIRNLCKSYANQKILKDISFTIERGEMVAITGKSGSGKSTLLHILAGVDKMDFGEYNFDGQQMNNLSERKLAKIRKNSIGYVMQKFGLISSLTAYENIVIPLQLNTFFGNRIPSELESIAKDLGIVESLNKDVRVLSGGEQQRVAIARALIINPKVILADEPTGSLDEKNAYNIMSIFNKLKRQGNTIIIVTHDKKIASQCDREITILPK